MRGLPETKGIKLRTGSGSDGTVAIAFSENELWGECPFSTSLYALYPSKLAYPYVIMKGIIPEKAFSENSLPTATLPKAMLLFSHLLPAAKLLLKIPSCTAKSPILHTRWRSALILR